MKEEEASRLRSPPREGAEERAAKQGSEGRTKRSRSHSHSRHRSRSKSHSPSRSRDRKRRRKKDDKDGREERRSSSGSRRREKRSPSSSSSSPSTSDTSEDSDSDSSSRQRRHRREKKEDKKKRKKEKERKKRRKDKKDKKKKKKRQTEGSTKTVPQWGAYGIVREADLFTKQPEFTAYLLEVKRTSPEGLSNWERKNLWKDFMEDYNTATMPSKKYYNLAAWEYKQRAKQLKRMQKLERKGIYPPDPSEEPKASSSSALIDDQEALRQARRKRREEEAFQRAYRERRIEKMTEEFSKHNS